MTYSIASLPHALDVGLTGSNRQFEFGFDITPWQEKYPEAVFAVCVRRSGEDETQAYFGDTRVEDGVLLWTVHLADLGTCSGNGRIEIWAIHPSDTPNDEPILKAGPIITHVRQSIAESASSEVPEAAQPWVNSVLAAAGNIEGAHTVLEAVQSATEAARDAALTARAGSEAARDAAVSAQQGASAAKSEAESAADRAEQAAGTSGFIEMEINSNGHLIFKRTANATALDFSLVAGHLVMEVE